MSLFKIAVIKIVFFLTETKKLVFNINKLITETNLLMFNTDFAVSDIIKARRLFLYFFPLKPLMKSKGYSFLTLRR